MVSRIKQKFTFENFLVNKFERNFLLVPKKGWAKERKSVPMFDEIWLILENKNMQLIIIKGKIRIKKLTSDSNKIVFKKV